MDTGTITLDTGQSWAEPPNIDLGLLAAPIDALAAAFKPPPPGGSFWGRSPWRRSPSIGVPGRPGGSHWTTVWRT